MEHTKCKPVTATVVVQEHTRIIIDYSVAQIPAFGHLAATSRKKYRKRADHSRRERDALFKRKRSRSNGQVESIANAMGRLMHNNVASYKRFLSGTGHENLLQDSWYLNVFKGKAYPNLTDLAWKLRIDRGAPLRIIDGAELRELEPHISDEYHSAVVIEGQSRTIAPGRLCKVLDEQAISQGVVMKTVNVMAITPLPTMGFELICTGETITAQRLVVAGVFGQQNCLNHWGFLFL